MVVLSSNEESLGKPAGIRMGRRIKVLAFISAGTATLGGAALLLFLTEVYSPLNWQKIAASLLLITGILLAFILFLLKNTAFRDRRKLFYAVLPKCHDIGNSELKLRYVKTWVTQFMVQR